MAKFSVIPKRHKYEFEVLVSSESEETEVVTFWGYEKGPSCPVPIVIEVDNVYLEYEEDYPNTEEQEKLGLDKSVVAQKKANMLLYRNLLMTVIPGLPAEIANILASPGGTGMKILEELGYYQPIELMPESESDSENTKEGEVEETGPTQ